jgi:hypothetical protein
VWFFHEHSQFGPVFRTIPLYVIDYFVCSVSMYNTYDTIIILQRDEATPPPKKGGEKKK